jgi:hypothetical protein
MQRYVEEIVDSTQYKDVSLELELLEKENFKKFIDALEDCHTSLYITLLTL